MSKDKSKDKHCDYSNFKRARYFHGMLMTDRDFREEQIYHNEKRKLLNRMLHGWGIVCGLGVKWKQGKNVIAIEPGVALDCHGNEIVVCDPYEVDLGPATCLGATRVPQKPLTAEECEELEKAKDQVNTFYIGIRYDEVPTDPVPVYAPGGGCEEKVCDYSRTREGFCADVFSQMPSQPQRGFIDPSLIQRFLDNCKGIGEIDDGTTYSFTANTITLEEDASGEDGFYNDMEIEIEFDIPGQPRSEQTRKIVAYNGTNKVAEVDQKWNPIPPADAVIDYEITNEECLRQQTQEFKDAFCANPQTCPQCCPEEHYVILGQVEIDPTKRTVQNIYLNNDGSGRSYVPTVRLARYIYSSLLNGLDTFFEVEKKDGETEPLPDINLIHTNPVAALCWLGQAFIDKVEIKQVEKKVTKPKKVRTEVASLRREVKELRNTVEQLTKKTKKKGG